MFSAFTENLSKALWGRAGAPHVLSPHLDGRHTIYGQLVEGWDALTAIERLGSPGAGRTQKPIIIERASISVE